MDKSVMIEQLVNYYSNGNKTRFASLLELRPQTINSWIARSTFDAELIYAKCEGVSASWLLSGEGDMLESDKSQHGHIVNADDNSSVAIGEAININSGAESSGVSQLNIIQQLIDMLSKKEEVILNKEEAIAQKEHAVECLLHGLNEHITNSIKKSEQIYELASRLHEQGVAMRSWQETHSARTDADTKEIIDSCRTVDITDIVRGKLGA